LTEAQALPVDIAHIREAFHVFRSRDICAGAKCLLLRYLLLGPQSFRFGEKTLRVGTGAVFLNPRHAPDVDVFREIFVRQIYRAEFANCFVVDIGAHKGCFAAYAASHGASQIDCFEPAQDNFAALRRVAASFANTQTKIVLHQAAVGAAAGRAELYVTDQSWSHSLIRRSDRTVLGSTTIQVRSLQDILEQSRAAASQRRLIVKLDIEGLEAETVLGTSIDALALIDELFIELHRSCENHHKALVARLELSGLLRKPHFDRMMLYAMHFKHWGKCFISTFKDGGAT
jgi:FkbM family methyltransferase